MKKLATLGALIVAAQFAYAQPAMDKQPCGHHGPPSVEQRVQRMTGELGLSPEQAEKITAILQNYQQQHKALRKQMREQFKQERQQIDAVLTDQQKQKLADRRRGPAFDDR